MYRYTLMSTAILLSASVNVRACDFLFFSGCSRSCDTVARHCEETANSAVHVAGGETTTATDIAQSVANDARSVVQPLALLDPGDLFETTIGTTGTLVNGTLETVIAAPQALLGGLSP